MEQQVRSLNNLNYMLNAYRSNWNCDVHTSNADTYINFLAAGSGVYRLQLQSDPTRFLTADSTAAKSNVSWKPAAGGSDQLWKLDAVSSWIADSFNFQQVTVNGFTLNIITTRPDNPDNIFLKNIETEYLYKTSYYGINGAFFGIGGSFPNVLNIAANNGVPVGDGGHGSGEDGSMNGADDGQEAIIYCRGKLEELYNVATLQQIITAKETPVWTQGGVSFRFGNSNWYKKGVWTGGHDPDSTSTGRTAPVVDTSNNLVYLISTITSSAKSITAFRSALETHFGITDSSGGPLFTKVLCWMAAPPPPLLPAITTGISWSWAVDGRSTSVSS